MQGTPAIFSVVGARFKIAVEFTELALLNKYQKRETKENNFHIQSEVKINLYNCLNYEIWIKNTKSCIPRHAPQSISILSD